MFVPCSQHSNEKNSQPLVALALIIVIPCTMLLTAFAIVCTFYNSINCFKLFNFSSIGLLHLLLALVVSKGLRSPQKAVQPKITISRCPYEFTEIWE